MGGKISNEFMWFDEEYGQDTVLCNDEIGLYVSEEVFELEDESLKELMLGKYKNYDTNKFEKRKACELGHLFQNNQFYSKMMNGMFVNREGKQDYYWNGSYGIGVSRILCLLAVNSFRKYGKFVWEDNIASFKVNIIAKNETMKEAESLYIELKSRGVEVCFDNRENLSIGEKIKDNELFGIRRTIVVGNEFARTGNFEFEDRKNNEKQILSKEKVLNLF